MRIALMLVCPRGAVVMDDGINHVPALHAADVSIRLDNHRRLAKRISPWISK
jgi:cation transport ATPase